MSIAPFSLANVQGDILFGLPKQAQSFFFFSINQPQAFRSNLGHLVPLITTADQTKSNISEIRQVKVNQRVRINAGDGEAVHPDVVTVSGVNIAFSSSGLKQMNITDSLDFLFDGGMRGSALSLGDTAKTNSDGTTGPDWDSAFLQDIHGVALITGDSRASSNQKLRDVKNILSTSVKEITTINGDVRPGDEKGHEHFGYLDGVSNPTIQDVDAINPGQRVIDQGVILMGRGNDDPSSRPSWAWDGSILAFRKLPQLVPEFDKFLLDTAGSQQGADLMGARFVGRWKSGAPIELTPTADNATLGADASANNNFSFDAKNQSKCPFSAHVRKMNPRGDLAGGDSGIDSHRIIRRGIPFGPEVSDAERASGTTSQERGLLFVCYQSVISNGFSFLQQAWANNDNFPFSEPQVPGFDPIIGQHSDGSSRIITGANANNVSQPLTLLRQWVNSKGGEYFFSPSIPTLKNVFAIPSNSTH